MFDLYCTSYIQLRRKISLTKVAKSIKFISITFISVTITRKIYPMPRGMKKMQKKIKKFVKSNAYVKIVLQKLIR